MKFARKAGQLASRGSFRAAAFALFTLAVTWPVLSTAGSMNLFRDAQVLYSYERDAAWSVLHFGSVPLWDPYYCGGLYVLGTPQSRFASPTFLLSLLFGPARGQALTIFAMIVLGLEGTFRYLRIRGGGALASLLAAPVFAASGVFIASPFLGWTNFFGFELFPWVLLFLRRALRGETAAAVWAALVLAWMVGFGGTYAVPMVALLGVYQLGEWLLDPRRDWPERRRAIGLCAFIATFALAIAAVRVAPLIETLRLAPRVIAGRPGMTPFAALRALVNPVTVKRDGNLVSTQTYLVGAVALTLAMVGLCRRRSWPLVPLGVAAFFTALGNALGPWGPFALLERLPLYSALRYPERYLIVVALVVAVLAANGLRLFEIVARRHGWARRLVVLSAVLLVANAGALLFNFHEVASARLLAPPPLELSRPFRQARGNRWLAAFYAPMSRGSLSCWDAYPVPMSPLLQGDLPAEEYLLDPAAGSVTRRRWTPNTIDLVTLSRPTELLINQNFHTGWRSNVGQVRNHGGLLAVALPAGAEEVRLSFRPRSAVAGAVSSLVACLIACWLIRRGRRGGKFSPAQSREGRWLTTATLVPLALFAIIYGLIPESRAVSAPLRAPTGEDVLVSGLPAGAVGIGATFGDGIVLDGVKAPPSAAVVPGDPSMIEIDWRVAGAVPRDTEIVLSFESRGGALLGQADHELVSAALRFTDAPPGVTLRDLIPFLVPAAAVANDVDVWVGVRDGGSHQPLRVSAKGRPTRADGRVLVATLSPPVPTGAPRGE